MLGDVVRFARLPWSWAGLSNSVSLLFHAGGTWTRVDRRVRSQRNSGRLWRPSGAWRHRRFVRFCLHAVALFVVIGSGLCFDMLWRSCWFMGSNHLMGFRLYTLAFMVVISRGLGQDWAERLGLDAVTLGIEICFRGHRRDRLGGHGGHWEQGSQGKVRLL